MSVNKVILVGNVGAPPTVKLIDGQTLATMSLATTEPSRTTASGVVIPEQTEWHRLVMWGHNANFAEKYIGKGTKLYVEGSLRTRTWQDQSAIKRQVTEILVEKLEILSRPTQ